MLKRIVSGAQTGADRGALYAARDVGFSFGGWVPKGYLSEDGSVPQYLRIGLVETSSDSYSERTGLNVRDSDATLVCHLGKLGVGSQLTLRCVQAQRRPFATVCLAEKSPVIYTSDHVGVRKSKEELWEFLKDVEVLNVAGPRESHAHGLENLTWVFVAELISALR